MITSELANLGTPRTLRSLLDPQHLENLRNTAHLPAPPSLPRLPALPGLPSLQALPSLPTPPSLQALPSQPSPLIPPDLPMLQTLPSPLHHGNSARFPIRSRPLPATAPTTSLSGCAGLWGSSDALSAPPSSGARWPASRLISQRKGSHARCVSPCSAAARRPG